MGRLGESARAFRRAFGNPAIRRLELGWAGANFGTWAYAIAVAVFAYGHGGATTVGIVGFARWGAAALVAPWLALAADWFPRRRVMITADLVRAAALGLAAVTVYAHWSPLLVYVLSGVVAAAASAFHPAESALRPSLARTPEELTAANVVSSTIMATGVLGGPALGGALLAASGIGVVFVVSAAMLLWSAGLVFSIRVADDAPPGRTQGESVVGAALAGFTTIVHESRLRVVMGLFTAQLLVNGMSGVLVVVIAIKLLGLGGAGVGWLNAANGIGGVIGAIVAAALVGSRRLGRDFTVGLALSGIPLALVAAWTSTGFVLVLLALVGIGETISDVAGMTLLQRIAPEDVLARVFGVFNTLVLVTLAVGALIAPGLIHLLGTRGTLIAIGVLLPALVVLTSRRVVALDREATVPERQLELLRALPLFAPLPPPELERLAHALVPVEVAAGTAVVTEGEPGDRFYVIDAGRAVVETETPRELGPGDFFGEIALLRDLPRTATVRALESLQLFALDRDDFVSTVTGHAPSAEAAESVIAARLSSPVRA